MPDFECLYFLENFYLDIIEVKRLDLPHAASAAEKFHWLKIEKETKRVSPLTFRSMDSSGEIEERYFEEGFLKFKSTSGTFIEKYNSAQHPLHHRDCLKLSSDLAQSIEAYFAQTVES